MTEDRPPNILLIIADQHTGAVTTQRGYEYILFDGGANPEQLFDLLNDPGELHPVTYNPEYHEQLIAHRNMLLEWDKKIDDNDFNPVGKFPGK